MLIQYSYFNIRYSNINIEPCCQNSFMILVFGTFSFLYLVSFIPFICQSFLAVPSVKLNDLVLRGNGLKVRESWLLRFQAKRNAYRGVNAVSLFNVYDAPFSSTSLAFTLTCIQYLGM